MKVYEIFSLDIWGNQKDGYETNNIYNIGFFIEADEFPPTEKIIKILKKEGYLKKRYIFASKYPWDEFDVIIYKKTQEPIYQIMESTNSDYLDGRWFTNYPYTRNSIVYRYKGGKIRKIQ